MVAPRNNPTPEADARARFVALLNLLELNAAEREAEARRWAKERETHVRLMHAAAWAALAMLAVCGALRHWLAYVPALLVLAWIGVVVLWKRGEHTAERMAHECRLTQLERRREAILRGDF